MYKEYCPVPITQCHGSFTLWDFAVGTERQIKNNRRGIVSKGDENTAVKGICRSVDLEIKTE